MIIIAHKFCTDGFTASWVLSKKYPGATFLYANYGDTPPDVKDQDIIVADFSYPRDVMLKMKSEAKSLLVLDHHKTAEFLTEPEFSGNVVFDLNKSGAMLAWDWIHKDVNHRQWKDFLKPDFYFGMEKLVEYVQDRDLWTWKLYDSKEVSAALASHELTFEEMDNLVYEIEDLRKEGAGILRYQEKLVKRICEDAYEAELGGVKCLAVNSMVLQSEVANKLSEGFNFGVAWYRKDGKFNYSLRNQESNSYDITPLAKSLGGGGHKHACGIKTDKDLLHGPKILPVDEAASRTLDRMITEQTKNG